MKMKIYGKTIKIRNYRTGFHKKEQKKFSLISSQNFLLFVAYC